MTHFVDLTLLADWLARESEPALSETALWRIGHVMARIRETLRGALRFPAGRQETCSQLMRRTHCLGARRNPTTTGLVRSRSVNRISTSSSGTNKLPLHGG